MKALLRHQCAAAGGVAFHFKQRGVWREVDDGPACRICGCTENNACDGGCSWAEDNLCSACVGAAGYDGDRKVMLELVDKGKAGRELDGRMHDGYPKAPP